MARKTSKKGNYNDTRKYLYIGGLILIAFFLISGIYTLVNYETNYKFDTSYLVTTKTIKSDKVLNINNAKDTLIKVDGDYFIYVSYSGNSSVYDLEVNLKKVINSYNIGDKLYYLDISSIKNDADVVDKVNAYLGYRDAKVSKVPTIIYVNKNNIVKIENIISREDNNLMTVGDFQKLLDINDFSK